MTISILVAVSENMVIGVDNQLPWHLPADLKYFKQLTSGHTIIMGRKTYESIGRPLPNRRNIVISMNKEFNPDGVDVFGSMQDALEACSEEQEIFIIGGGMIYKESLHRAQKLYITRVHTHIKNGTAFFPDLDPEQWRLLSEIEHPADDKNALSCTFETYERVA